LEEREEFVAHGRSGSQVACRECARGLHRPYQRSNIATARR
jgi:hypothetical protein